MGGEDWGHLLGHQCRLKRGRRMLHWVSAVHSVQRGSVSKIPMVSCGTTSSATRPTLPMASTNTSRSRNRYGTDH